MGSITTIQAGEAFADRLASTLLDRYGGRTDNRLADALVLLPTRRAVRSLTQAFLRASDGQALVLPSIQPLGDLDDDEPAMLSPDRLAETEVQPAIGSVERQMLLARMVLARDEAPDPASAFGLAQSLAELLDETATERLDFGKLTDLAPERFQEHWRRTIDFLQIVTSAWPEVLAERGLVDPATRRDLLAARLAGSWRKQPPTTPVWIAGSTGSVPGTVDLMRAVIDLPEGCIVLPGLDVGMDPHDRQAALEEPVHPQHGMLSLLRELGKRPQDVVIMGGETAQSDRQILLSEALRPAGTSDRWGDLSHIGKQALQNISVIEAQGPREEAMSIAIRLREALNEPGKTAALITPDRDLARRVAAEMLRFGVRLDDSAGTPLRLTRAGSFLQLAAVALGGGLAPADLLALFKHPLAAAGNTTVQFRRDVRRLERRHLRGMRRYETLQQLADRVENDPDVPMELPWLRLMDGFTSDFVNAEGDLAAAVTAQIRMCEWLAGTDDEDGAERLWVGEDGEAAAEVISRLLDAAPHAPPIPPENWAASFDRLTGGATVRPRFGLHPRLSILGPLEARLQKFDLTILGGLNETVWPASPGRDPWMSRPMRAAFGLPSPERRTGLQAHDFIQLSSAGTIILTRSKKSGGAPTVASRWLMRLQSIAAGAGLNIPHDSEAAVWAHRLDEASETRGINAPAPCPPAEARPVRLPVTAIETLIRDPYAIFGRRILRLRPLDPIDDQPGPLLKGNLMHAAFERFAEQRNGAWSPADWPVLKTIGREVLKEAGLPASWLALWTRRFDSAAQWLLQAEADREETVEKRWVEIEGELHGLPGLPGFTLTAKADRLDRLVDGSVVIADYKTGNPPTARQVEAGFAVQLPLTGLILMSGGFADITSTTLHSLLHIQVHGTRDGGAWKPVRADDLIALVQETAEGVGELLADYANPQTPYRSRPYVQFARGYTSDYDHLARVAEWSVTGDDGDGA